MSAAGRARIIALVEAVVPTIDPRVRFVCAQSGRGGGVTPLGAGPATRRFDLISTMLPVDTAIASALPAQWRERWDLRIEYQAPDTADAERIDRQIASDVRAIQRALAVTGDWATVLDTLDARGTPTRERVTAGLRVSIPLDVTYQETGT